MTTNELRNLFNGWIEDAGIEWTPPGQYFVDAITYANVCNEIFKKHFENAEYYTNFARVTISVGMNGGIMFKNIELIYDPAEDKK